MTASTSCCLLSLFPDSPWNTPPAPLETHKDQSRQLVMSDINARSKRDDYTSGQMKDENTLANLGYKQGESSVKLQAECYQHREVQLIVVV